MKSQFVDSKFSWALCTQSTQSRLFAVASFLWKRFHFVQLIGYAWEVILLFEYQPAWWYGLNTSLWMMDASNLQILLVYNLIQQVKSLHKESGLCVQKPLNRHTMMNHLKSALDFIDFENVLPNDHITILKYRFKWTVLAYRGNVQNQRVKRWADSY